MTVLFSQVRRDGTATFFYPYRDAGSVHVSGSFCGWQSPGVPLRRVDQGWVAEVTGVPAGEVEYKLVVDGRWVPDPINLVRRADGLGGESSVLRRGGDQGSVQHLEFYSPSLGETRGYALYLPAGYGDAGRRFPVLYLLHGALDGESSWIERGGLIPAIEGLRAGGQIGEMIVVMPRENGGLFRGDGRVAEYLARDLVGHIDYEFPTLADARHRGLDGLSTGGFTSTVLGALRPGVWGSIGSMSGSHDGRSFDAVRAHAAAMAASGQRHLISSGAEEVNAGTCRALAHELESRGVRAVYAEGPGIHDWPTWRAALPGHLRFHSASFAA
jgi:enterochelin esterase-like enzyme